MSRYVDIEGDWVDEAVKTYSLGYYDNDEYAIPFEALDSAPSIDIVRCKECMHRDDDHYFCYRCAKEDDDYCSRAERKESE